MTGDILASIDGALRDCEVSRDAMRWNPALSDARGAPRPVPEAWPAVHLEITADFSRFAETMAQLGETIRQAAANMACTLGVTGIDSAALVTHLTHSRLARIRCRDCNPRGNPGPLAVNGHEYRRRSKARARRKRN